MTRGAEPPLPGARSAARCWKCGRHLGPMCEHQKMVTEKGPICYACFNAAQEEAERPTGADRDPD